MTKLKTTVDLISEIVGENNLIPGINVHSFPFQPQIQDRLIFDKIEQFHYNQALKLRDKYNFPFWDSLMLSFYNKREFSIEILRNVLNNHKKREIEYVSREEIFTNKLNEYRDLDQNYALNSRLLTTEDRIRHLILLDFHIPASFENQKVVEAILNILDLKSGFLLFSGRSYHFLGNNLVSTSFLLKFLGKCLFFSPIIDKSWIAHQIIDKSCSIRITRKNGVFPILIKRINI